MKRVILIRQPSTDQGTFGVLHVDDLKFSTGELPWRGNQHKVSCIPEGVYVCKWVNSPSKGWCYQVTGVPNRDHILMHVANWCGDVSMGYRSDVEGCIGLGVGFGEIHDQKAIIMSGAAIKQFNDHMAMQDFELEVKHAQ